MDDERAIELYARSRKLRKPLDGHASFARFARFPKPAPLLDDREGFLTAAQQDAQDLSNFVNEFTLNLNALDAWAQMIPELGQDELLGVTMEFVNPLGYFCLDAPYALKSRFCWSVARVSHLANEFRDRDWQHIEDLGNSSEDKAAKHAGGWAAWPRLRGRLASLDNHPFRKSVDGFRNAFHHGSPRMLETGSKSAVWRKGGLTVTGAIPPLPVVDVVAALRPQQRAAVDVHQAYLDLLEQQVSHVMANKRIEQAPRALS